jgi:hypothetical protein
MFKKFNSIAIYYDIKCSYDVDYLIKYESRATNLTSAEENTITSPYEYILPISLASSSFKDYKPSQGGSNEFFVLNTDIYSSNEDIVGIKMRAVDASGNLGAWSNVVIIKLNNKIKFSPLLSQANGGAFGGSFMLDENSSAALASESKSSLIKLKEDRYFYYFMIFIACLSLILLVQIVMIIILTLNKLRDRRDSKVKRGKPAGVHKDEFQKLEESVESGESCPSLLIQRV